MFLVKICGGGVLLWLWCEEQGVHYMANGVASQAVHLSSSVLWYKLGPSLTTTRDIEILVHYECFTQRMFSYQQQSREISHECN